MLFPALRRDKASRGRIVRLKDLQPSDESLLILRSNEDCKIYTNQREEIPQTTFAMSLVTQREYAPANTDTFVKGVHNSTWYPYLTLYEDTEPIYAYGDGYGFLFSGAGVFKGRMSVELKSEFDIFKIGLDNQHGHPTTGNLTYTNRGVETLTVYASNDRADFLNTAYGEGNSVVNLGTFDIDPHTPQREPEFQELLLNNGNHYKYYIFDLDGNHGDPTYTGINRLRFFSSSPDKNSQMIQLKNHTEEYFLQTATPSKDFNKFIEYPLSNADNLEVPEGNVSFTEDGLVLNAHLTNTLIRSEHFFEGDLQLLAKFTDVELAVAGSMTMRFHYLQNYYHFIKVTQDNIHVGHHKFGVDEEVITTRRFHPTFISGEGTASASNTQGGSNSPEAAIDGNKLSWYSTGTAVLSTPVSWQLDLGSIFSVSGIVIYGPGHDVTHNIQISSDGTNFTDIHTYLNTDTSPVAIATGESTARYIKINMTDSGGWGNWSELFEVEVYSTAYIDALSGDFSLTFKRDGFVISSSHKEEEIWYSLNNFTDNFICPLYFEIEAEGIFTTLSELRFIELDSSSVAPLRLAPNEYEGEEHHFWKALGGLVSWRPRSSHRFLSDPAALQTWTKPDLMEEDNGKVYYNLTSSSIADFPVDLREFTMFCSFRQRSYGGSLVGENIRVEHDGSGFIIELGSYSTSFVYGLVLDEWYLITLQVSSSSINFWLNGVLLLTDTLNNPSGSIQRVGDLNEAAPNFNGDIEFLYLLDGVKSSSFIENFKYSYYNDIIDQSNVLSVDYEYNLTYTIDGRNVKSDMATCLVKVALSKEDFPHFFEELTHQDQYQRVYIEQNGVPLFIELPLTSPDPDVFVFNIELRDLERLTPINIIIFYGKNSPLNWYYAGYQGSWAASQVYDDHYVTVMEPHENLVDNNKSFVSSTSDSVIHSYNTTQTAQRTNIGPFPACSHNQQNTGFEDRGKSLNGVTQLSFEIYGHSLSGPLFHDCKYGLDPLTYSNYYLYGSSSSTLISCTSKFTSTHTSSTSIVTDMDTTGRYLACTVDSAGYQDLYLRDQCVVVDDTAESMGDHLNMSSYPRFFGSTTPSSKGTYACVRLSDITRETSYYYLQFASFNRSLNDFEPPEVTIDKRPCIDSAGSLYLRFSHNEFDENNCLYFTINREDASDIFELSKFDDPIWNANLNIYGELNDPIVSVVGYGENTANIKIEVSSPPNINFSIRLYAKTPNLVGYFLLKGRIGDSSYIEEDLGLTINEIEYGTYLIDPPVGGDMSKLYDLFANLPVNSWKWKSSLFDVVEEVSAYPTVYTNITSSTAGRWWYAQSDIRQPEPLTTAKYGVYNNGTLWSDNYVTNKEPNPDVTLMYNPLPVSVWHNDQISSNHLFNHCKDGNSRIMLIGAQVATVANAHWGGVNTYTNKSYTPSYELRDGRIGDLIGPKKFNETSTIYEKNYDIGSKKMGSIRVNADVDTTLNYPVFFTENDQAILVPNEGGDGWFLDGEQLPDPVVYECYAGEDLQGIINDAEPGSVILIDNAFTGSGSYRYIIDKPLYMRSMDPLFTNPYIGIITLKVQVTGKIVLDHLDFSHGTNWSVAVIVYFTVTDLIWLHGCEIHCTNYAYCLSQETGNRYLRITNSTLNRGYAHLFYRGLGGITEFWKNQLNNTLYIYQNGGSHIGDDYVTSSVNGYGHSDADPVLVTEWTALTSKITPVYSSPSFYLQYADKGASALEAETNKWIDFEFDSTCVDVNDFTKPVIHSDVSHMVGDDGHYNYSIRKRILVMAYPLPMSSDFTILFAMSAENQIDPRTIFKADDFTIEYRTDALHLISDAETDFTVCPRELLIRTPIKLTYQSELNILRIDQPVELEISIDLQNSTVIVGDDSREEISYSQYNESCYLSFVEHYVPGVMSHEIDYVDYTPPPIEDPDLVEGWDPTKVINGIIPASLVDEPESDFPLLLKISNSSGLNTYDFAELLTEISNPILLEDWTQKGVLNPGIWYSKGIIQQIDAQLQITQGAETTSKFEFPNIFDVEIQWDTALASGSTETIDDDFAGETDDSPNDELWSCSESLIASYAKISTQHLKLFKAFNEDPAVEVTSIYQLEGDFEIEVQVPVSESGPYIGAEMRFEVIGTGSNVTSIGVYNPYTANDLKVRYNETTTYIEDPIAPFAFKLKRTGSLHEIFYDSGSGWVNVLSEASGWEDAAKVRFVVDNNNSDATQNCIIEFDNFKGTADTINWLGNEPRTINSGDFHFNLVTDTKTYSLHRVIEGSSTLLRSDFNGTEADVSFTAGSGFFRFTREASNLITCFYKLHLTDNWVTLNSIIDSDLVKVRISSPLSTGGLITSNRFRVSSNSYNWPDHIPYDVRFLALEDEYGRYISGEVVYSAEDRLHLYCKIPYVHASTDTVFKIRYDSTQDSERISFSGSYRGKDVWDTHNIKSVFHLNTETVNYTESVMDSSAGQFHGTPKLSHDQGEIVSNFVDEFIGEDGDPADQDIWLSYISSNNSTGAIINNKFHMTISAPTANTYSCIRGPFRLHGDFDVQFDFSNFSTTHNSYGTDFRLRTEHDSYYQALIRINRYFNCRFMYNGSSWQTNTNYTRTNNYGSVRIKRIGSRVENWTRDGGGAWTLRNYYNSWGTGAIYLDIGQWTVTGQSTVVDVDNFRINSGQVDWNNDSQIVTPTPHLTDSPIGLGQVFNGINDWMEVNDSGRQLIGGSHSLSCWKRSFTGGNSMGSPMAINTSSNGDTSVLFDYADKIIHATGSGTATNTDKIGMNEVWTQRVITYDENGSHIYDNGDLLFSDPSAVSIAGADLISLGQDFDGHGAQTDFFNGDMAEVRFHREVLTPNWIKLDYLTTRDQLMAFSHGGLELPNWENSEYYTLGLNIQPTQMVESLFLATINLSMSCDINGFDASALFDEVGDEELRIAIFQGDEELTCCVSNWDAVTKTGTLHVNINASLEDELRLYYDVSQPANILHVGGPTSIVGQSVFDDYSVYWMGDTLYSEGTFTLEGGITPPYFDGEDDEIFIKANHNHTSTFTLSVSLLLDDVLNQSQTILSRQQYPHPNVDTYCLYFAPNRRLRCGSYGGGIESDKSAWNDNVPYHLSVVKEDLEGKIFVNSLEEDLPVDAFDSIVGGANEVCLGGQLTGSSRFKGTINYVKICREAKSEKKIQLEYLCETNELFIFNDSQEEFDYTEWDENKILEFIIETEKFSSDHEKIELDIYINNDSGVSNSDLEYIFDELDDGFETYPKNLALRFLGLVQKGAGDNFNNLSLDTRRWSPILTNTGTIALTSGKLIAYGPSNAANDCSAVIRSQYTLVDDFDIELEHMITEGYSGVADFSCFLEVSGGNSISIRDNSTGTTHDWVVRVNGSDQIFSQRTHTFGKFRIVRIDDTFTTYGMESYDGEWINFRSVSLPSMGDECIVNVGMRKRLTSATAYKAEFDNLVINSGEGSWENGYPYHEEEWLPIEITEWDRVTKKGIIRTLLPEILISGDCVLKLCFDRTQSPNPLVNLHGEGRHSSWKDHVIHSYSLPSLTDAISLSTATAVDLITMDTPYGKMSSFNGSTSLVETIDNNLISDFIMEFLFKTDLVPSGNSAHLFSLSQHESAVISDSAFSVVIDEDEQLKINFHGQEKPSVLYSGVFLRVGSGQEYTTVTAAYDAAEPGDVLLIEPGTYLNESLSIYKQVHFLGNTNNPRTNQIIISANNSSQNFKFYMNNSTEWYMEGHEVVVIEKIRFYHTYSWRHFVSLYQTRGKIVFNRCSFESAAGAMYPVCGPNQAGADDLDVEFRHCIIDRGYSHFHQYSYGRNHLIKCYLTGGAYYCHSACNRSLATSDYVTTPTTEYGDEYGVSYEDIDMAPYLGSETEITLDGPILDSNSYYHIALVTDKTTRMTSLYVDGTLTTDEHFFVNMMDVPHLHVVFGQPSLDVSGSGEFSGNLKFVKITDDKKEADYFNYRNLSVQDELLRYEDEIPATSYGTNTNCIFHAEEAWDELKKIEITIPTSAEVLIDFPLPLTLAQVSGTSDSDLLEIFNDLHAPTSYSADDTFTSFDDTRWRREEYEGFINFVDDQLRMTATTTSTSGYQGGCKILSNFELDGDFDIMVRGDSTDLVVDATDLASQVLTITIEDNTFKMGVKADISKVFYIYSNNFPSFDNPDLTSIVAYNDEWEFRLLRIGALLRGFIRTTGDWIEIASEASAPEAVGDIGLSLENGPSGIAHNHACLFDNFNHNSGDILWKPDTHCQKIRILDGNGDELYVEVEDWQESAAKIWVKVPEISDSVDTILTLYYDIDHPNNREFIGLTGTTLVRTVWNDNYVLSTHFNQYPSEEILDSTSNLNHGTSSGNMTSSQLVDMNPGKGIELDSIDDLIRIPYSSELDITDTLTVEVTFRPNINLEPAVIDDNLGFVSRQHDPTADEDTYFLAMNDSALLHFGSFGGNIQGTQNSWVQDQRYVIAGTFDSNGLVGDLFVDGVKEILTTDNYETMAGSLNDIVIGNFVSSFAPITIDEIRISNIVRSDTWLNSAGLSGLDNFVSYDRDAAIIVDNFPYFDVTIPKEEVEEETENFPVLLDISDSSGIDGTDLTAFFTELEVPCCNLDFFGDGELPNYKAWTPTRYADVSLVDNRLKLYVQSGASLWSNMTSKFLLRGDFDIQVDWEVTSTLNSDTGVCLFLFDSDNAQLYLIDRGGSFYTFNDIQGASTIGNSATSDTSGKFRFIRVGDNLEGQVWTASAWLSLGSTTYDGDVRIDLNARNWNTNPEIIAYFDNFTLIHDELIWPNGYPNAQRVSITYQSGKPNHPDLGKQQVTEISSWDQVNNSAQLWTKAHNLSPDFDTVLRLHYSDDMPLNSGYLQHTDEPLFRLILDYGKEGFYDEEHASGPGLVRNDDGSFEMWYTGTSSSLSEALIKTKSFDGINWLKAIKTIDNTTSIAPYDDQVRSPYIIKENDNSYKIWYSVTDTSNSPYNYGLMYAISSDGLTWSNHQLVLDSTTGGVYTTNGVGYCSIHKEHGSLYKMWFSGYDGTNWRIMYTTSVDGITWDASGMVLDLAQEGTYDTQGVSTPQVIVLASGYIMFYNVNDGTNHRMFSANSVDGITWTNHQLVVDINSEGTYDTEQIWGGSVIEMGEGIYYVAYGTRGTSNRILQTWIIDEEL